MRLIDADKIIFREIDEVGGEYEPYLGCSKSQIDSLPSITPQEPTDKNFTIINDLEELRTMINKFAESYENRLKADMVAMLDEIRAEIEMEKLEDSPNFCIKAHNIAVDRVLQIIDKHKTESEGK